MSSVFFALIVFSFGLFQRDFWWALTRGLGAFIFCVAIEGLYISYVIFSITEIAKGFYGIIQTIFA